jgi:hypothetical protein
MMIADQDISDIQQELEQMSNPDAFIVKYHKESNTEIQYLVILAYWRKIQEEQDQLIQLKRFISQYHTHKDMRIKRLIMFAIASLLRYQEDELLPYLKNDLCNELIKLGQNFTEQHDADMSLALCEAYEFKVQHLDEHDVFKAEYFYHRMMRLSKNLTGMAHLHYKFAAWTAQIKLAIQQQEDVEQQVEDFFNDFPIHTKLEIYAYFLDMFQAFLGYTSFNAHDHKFQQRLDFLERLIETEKFNQIINQSAKLNGINEILQYLTYLFWVGQRFGKSDVFALQYFRVTNQPIAQLLDDNFRFYISDDIDLNLFNQYMSEHYDKFVSLQKYRTLFGVQRKSIILSSTQSI